MSFDGFFAETNQFSQIGKYIYRSSCKCISALTISLPCPTILEESRHSLDVPFDVVQLFLRHFFEAHFGGVLLGKGGLEGAERVGPVLFTLHLHKVRIVVVELRLERIRDQSFAQLDSHENSFNVKTFIP